VSSGSQNPLTHDGGHLCINVVKFEVNISTRAHDYGSSHPVIGLEPPPMETYLHIDKLKPSPRILKGVLKRSSHNPDARSIENYLIIEDLGQTPCIMSALEVL
jgi:hypothetical protein